MTITRETTKPAKTTMVIFLANNDKKSNNGDLLHLADRINIMTERATAYCNKWFSVNDFIIISRIKEEIFDEENFKFIGKGNNKKKSLCLECANEFLKMEKEEEDT